VKNNRVRTKASPVKQQPVVQVDELEFDLKTKASKSSTKSSSLVEAALLASQNEVAAEAAAASGKKSSKSKTSSNDENVIQKEVEAVALDVIETATTTKKPKKSTTSEALTTGSSPQRYNNDLTMSRNAEKEQYFGKDVFESGTRSSENRIVLLNDSVYKYVKPSLQTSIVYHRWDVHRIFLVFFFFILAGEFFSAPAITLADQCTLQYLGPQRADLYGRQRMFGSLGWAVAMFSVGILLDHSKAFTNHPCGKAGPDERNYSACFAIYSCLMGCALIAATQFKFDYGDAEQIPLKAMAHSLKKQVHILFIYLHPQF
jgi:hypothetical protein